MILIFILVCGILVISLVLAIYYSLKLKRELHLYKVKVTDLHKYISKIEPEISKLQEKNMVCENNLRVKTKELIIKTKENDDKFRVLESIRKKVSEAINNPTKTKNKLHEMDLELDNFVKTDDQTFEMQMDEYNQEFMQLLKTRYPFITLHDQRICLYIKTGMSSQEIADIMNMLPSSIYISRSRLRKKLGLENDQDLYGFLTQLKNG